MDNSRRAILAFIGAVALTAHGAGTIETPLRDPWVPPALQKQRIVEPPAEGAALRAEVQGKLRASFDAAARPFGGTLTREQARAAGLGFIVQHFDAIDRRATGRVGADDYLRFLRERTGALD